MSAASLDRAHTRPVDISLLRNILRHVAGAGLGGYLGYRYSAPLGELLGDPRKTQLIGGGAGGLVGGVLPEIPGIIGGSILGSHAGDIVGTALGRGLGKLVARFRSDEEAKQRAEEVGATGGKVIGTLGGLIGGSVLGEKLLSKAGAANSVKLAYQQGVRFALKKLAQDLDS